MTAQPAIVPQWRNVDNTGAALVNGLLYTYVAGTTTPQATYTDSTQVTQNPNPIQLNARGEASIWLSTTLTYKFVLTDLNGNVLWTQDQIPGGFVPASQFIASIIAGLLDSYTAGPILASYNQTAAEISAGVTPVNFAYPPGWISRYGVNTTPGTTDMSQAITNMVNANKGAVCYIDSLCLMAGLIMNGSTYNGTQIRCVGAGMLKLKPLVGTGYNFDTSIWVGIAVQGCDQVLLDLAWDGNRVNQPQYEGIYCVAICGSTNVYCPGLRFREIRGDGLYIDWYSPIHSSGQANSQNVVVDYLYAYNTADDGRNACSVISCQGLTIGQFSSYRVGGLVNSVLEPGGLDLEPNWPAQDISDVTVGTANIITAGGTGISISGKSVSGNDANQDWNIGRVKIGASNILFTANGNFLIARAFDVKATVDIYHLTPYIGAQIDFANRCDVKLNIVNATIGLWAGAGGFVTDCDITVNLNIYGSTGFGGLMTTGAVRTTFRGKIYNAAVGGNAPAVQLNPNARTVTQSYVTYSMEFPYDPNVNLVFSNTTVTLGSAVCLKDCMMEGFALITQTNFQIPSYNCAGRNHGTGAIVAPTSGVWSQFDETVLDQTAGSTAPRAKCITGGTPGTWKLYANMQP
jgi:hypothetical protein